MNAFWKSLVSLALMGSLTSAALAQSTIISNSTKQALKANKALSLELFEQHQERDPIIDAGINNVVYLKLNKQALQQIINKKPATISFELPIEDQSLSMSMQQYDIFDPEFKANTKGISGVYESAARPDGVFYRGFSDGDDFSLAALSFFQNEIGGIISISGKKGNYNLALNKQNPGVAFDNYILYKESDIVDGSSHAPLCQNGSAQENLPGAMAARSGAANEIGLSCKTISLALYGDFKLFQKNQNNLAATQNYLTIVFNGVAALYQNDGIRIALKQLNVNTSDDFYPTNTSTEVLVEFGNEINTNVTADLMQFVTGHTITAGGGQYAPLGGLAWLNVLCTTPFYYQDYDTYVGPFSMINTAGSSNIPLVPIYSWDISCSTHELGHNLGSPHTHNCAWNGNNTAIDDCAGTFNAIYADNSCTSATIPSSGGTIMSYCHLLSGVGVNFVNGFGSQPGDLIRYVVDNATCLISDYIPKRVVNEANTTVNANGFCINNNELYCYDTKNDFDRNNDELILILQNNNISNLDLSNVQMSMVTNPGYASNAATDATSYAYVDPTQFSTWFTANRSWSVQLNQNLTGNTTITLPFLNQDRLDLNGSNPAMNSNNDSMFVLLYKTAVAAQDPTIAAATDVTVYPHGGGTTNWTFGSNADYLSASVNNAGGFFGATLATAQTQTNVGLKTFVNATIIKLFPNPASNILTLKYDGQLKDIQSLEIIDYLGRSMIIENPKSTEHQINIEKLSAGIYMIKCATVKGVYINKFVKQ